MSDQANDVYLLSAARTPIGKMLGGLATVPATELGAVAIRGASSTYRQRLHTPRIVCLAARLAHDLRHDAIAALDDLGHRATR